ncbi:porin family protein [Sporocytophaga myxococcoides]|uniref:porin family protein n=1 Tax=Sporocytophaga myxococcoides TaxID=153721 RepID=UPI00041A654B|nr:porin family protein [Sporocytophaga myxococcoides]
MRIKLLFFALTILHTNFIFAQTKKFQIGLEGGPGLASIDGKDRFKNNHSTKVGYAVALTLQYDISKILSIRTGVGFERKGYKMSLNNPLIDVDAGEIRFHYDYLTAPLLARIILGNKIKFFTNAGPYFAYLLNLSDDRNLIKYSPESWKQYYKRFDWGITAGIGGAVPVKDNLLLTLEARYNFGLINSSKYLQFKTYNNFAILLAGVAYKL